MTPDAEEVISYGMPTFKYKGRPLMHFGAFKDHMSLFPTAEPVAEMKSELGEYATAKGTIQFTADKPVPEEIIAKLISIRLEAINQR